MTLKIKNIRYDHSLDTRTYPVGVITVDSADDSLHVHDGVLPNGSRLPTASDLNDKADVSLGNVSQEDMTSLLSRYGALTMNDNKSVSEAQRDNLWDKLGGPAMRFDTEVPEHNIVTVDSNHKLQVIDSASSGSGFGFGIDVSAKIVRSANVPYKTERNCYVSVMLYTAGYYGAPAVVKLNDVQIAQLGWGAGHSGGTGNWQSSVLFPVARGQTYKIEPGSNQTLTINEFGVLPLFQGETNNG
jgi:hypothetical protein